MFPSTLRSFNELLKNIHLCHQVPASSAPVSSSFHLTDYPGSHMFSVKLELGSKQRRECQYSRTLEKLFINQNKSVSVRLQYSSHLTTPLSVSACLMFSSPEHTGDHVKVCYQHSHK